MKSKKKSLKEENADLKLQIDSLNLQLEQTKIKYKQLKSKSSEKKDEEVELLKRRTSAELVDGVRIKNQKNYTLVYTNISLAALKL